MKWKVRDWNTGLRSEKLEIRTLRENHESQEHFCIHTHDMNDQAQLYVKFFFACVICLLIVLTLMILSPLLMCTMWWFINHLKYTSLLLTYLSFILYCILTAFIMTYFMQMHHYSGVLRFAEGRALEDLRSFLTPEVGRGLVSIQLCVMYSLLLVTSNKIVLGETIHPHTCF